MQFKSSAVALLAVIITGASAAVTSRQSGLSATSCDVSHNSGNGGNQFTINWTGLPSAAEADICGNFNDAVQRLESSDEYELKGSVSCRTDGPSEPNIYTTLTLNKQSCDQQLIDITSAMSQALGVDAQGTAVSKPTCGNCPGSATQQD